MSKFPLVVIALAIAVVSNAQEVPTTETLEEQITELRVGAMYSEAVALGEELLSLRRSEPDARPDEVLTAEWLLRTLESAAALPDGDRLELARADSLRDLFIEMRGSGDLTDDAVELAEWQLETRRKHLGELHPDVAESCSFLAIFLDLAGDTERPEELLDEALRIVREVYGDEHPAVVMGNSWRAYLSVKRKDHAEAEPYYRDALAVARAVYGDEHDEVASLLHSLARVVAGQGRFDETEGLLTDALSMYRNLHGGEHETVARTLRILGIVQMYAGDFASADSNLQEALDLTRQVHGEEHGDVADLLNVLAGLNSMRGDYESAERLQEQELALRDRLEGLDGSGPSIAYLENSATFQSFRGNFAAAESLLREVLAIQRRTHHGDHADVARSLSALGDVLDSQGDYASAEPLLTEALEMRRRLFGEEHESVASSLSKLGELHNSQDDYGEAEKFYRAALAVTRAVSGDDSSAMSDRLCDLGSVLQDQGRLDEAESVLNQALEMESGSAQQVLGLSGARSSLAYVYIDRGDYERADRILQDFVTTVRRYVGDEYYGLAPLLCYLAQLSYLRGDYDAIEPLLTEATEIFDAARLGVNPGLKRSTFMFSPYPYLAAAELVQGRSEQAWPALELGQARSLAELLTVGARRDWTASERGRADSLAAVLGELEGQVAAYEEAARDGTSDDILSRLGETRGALLAAEADWSAFQLELTEKYPVAVDDRPSLERVQASLTDQSAILGWLDVEPKDGEYWSWGYVIRSSGAVAWAAIDSAFVPPPGRSTYDQVLSFRSDLARASTSGIGLARDARELWEARIAPLSGALEGVEELIVVPSGPMLGVTIEALIDSDGMHLGDKYSVSYAPSATVYAWLAEMEAYEGGWGALLVGDPPYNESHLAQVDGVDGVDLADAQSPESSLLRSALAGNEDALASLPRLYGTREEVAAVADVLRGSSLLVGAEATEQELARLAESDELGALSTIHIATHALVDGNQPERSALVLSQVDLPDALEAANAGERVYDGLLTAREIGRDWILNADLVTLSACETALGKEIEGEGYIGFARTFLEVGARSLLVSLWKVDDEATSLLMRRFYENWQGAYSDIRGGDPRERMSKAVALHEAKMWVRSYEDEAGGHPYEHPFYWSAFVLVGDRR